MRQAGRYLPEYRALRQKAGSFWGMALNPDHAAEVTIQPVRRFGFDAAILFSDILTVPEALGRKVTFTAGEGPCMTPVTGLDGFDRDLAHWENYFEPVYEALRRTRAGLDREGFGATTLLGFAGAPWTLATYLAAGAGGDEQKAAKLWAYRDPQSFARLLDILGECVAFHLVRQLRAGADAVQIFDSWASGLPAPLDWAVKALPCVLQGNLDPIALVAGGAALDRAVDTVLQATAGKPFIFNLGHGILQETPIAHVEQLVKRVRG
jgi:uroporphyrinogen decarboxylase